MAPPTLAKIERYRKLKEEGDLQKLKLAIADNPNTASETLAKLALDPKIEIRMSVAKNHSTPKDVLINMLNKDESEEVKNTVSMNPNLPVDESTDSENKILSRINAASNPKTSASTLANLAEDYSLKVRTSVAKNPNTPQVILDKLLDTLSLEVAVVGIMYVK